MLRRLCAILSLALAPSCASLNLDDPNFKAWSVGVIDEAAGRAALSAAQKLGIQDHATLSAITRSTADAATEALNGAVQALEQHSADNLRSVAAEVLSKLATGTSAVAASTGNPLAAILTLLLGLAGGAVAREKLKRKRAPPLPPLDDPLPGLFPRPPGAPASGSFLAFAPETLDGGSTTSKAVPSTPTGSPAAP